MLLAMMSSPQRRCAFFNQQLVCCWVGMLGVRSSHVLPDAYILYIQYIAANVAEVCEAPMLLQRGCVPAMATRVAGWLAIVARRLC